MDTVLLLAAIAVAGLACPAMMWWQRRRGRPDACCIPAASPTPGSSADGRAGLEELRRRRAEVEARITEFETDTSGAARQPRPEGSRRS